eukprot:3751098-Amphidinium_carterae.1
MAQMSPMPCKVRSAQCAARLCSALPEKKLKGLPFSWQLPFSLLNHSKTTPSGFIPLDRDPFPALSGALLVHESSFPH